MQIINEKYYNIISDFDYLNFLDSDNQVEYFKNFITTLVLDKTLPYKMPIIKRQLRCMNWQFLTSTGLLTPQFICLVITPKQLMKLDLISSEQLQNAIPIKILHYLNPYELCRNYNLMIPYQMKYYTDISDISDQSDNSYNSDISENNDYDYTTINGTLLQCIFNILKDDRIEYSNWVNSNEQINAIYSGTDDIVTQKPYTFDDYIERYSHDDGNNQTELYSDQIILNNRYCYSPRFSNLKYLIEQSEISNYSDNSIMFNYNTIDNIFKERYTQNVYQYTFDEYGNESATDMETKIVPYISDNKRTIGLDKKALIKYQYLPFDFICQYYTLEQISQYYTFTMKQLYDYRTGLYLNNSLNEWTEKSIQILFKYQNLDLSTAENKNYFKQFCIYNHDKISSKAEYNLAYYQKITDDGIIYEEVSSVTSSTSSSVQKFSLEDLKDNIYLTKAVDLSKTQYSKQMFNTAVGYTQVNGEFVPDFLQNAGSIVGIHNVWQRIVDNIEYNIKSLLAFKTGKTYQNCFDWNNYTTTYNGQLILQSNVLKNKTDTILLYNLSDSVKQDILNEIYMPFMSSTISANSQRTAYHLYDVKETNDNKKYLDLCIRNYSKKYEKLDYQTNIATNIYGMSTLNIGINEPVKYSIDNNYFIAGPRFLLTENLSCVSAVRVRVYLKDIIAIMHNKLIVAKKVLVIDKNQFYPKYTFITKTINGTNQTYLSFIA